MESDYQANNNIFPRKLKMSKSMEQPRKLILTEENTNMNNNNNNNNNNINSIINSNISKDKLIEDNISQDTKSTGPTVQSIMANCLNRPTSSPPSLIMPRPRYAVPPTRSVLKSFENEKTQLDPDISPQLQAKKNVINDHHHQEQESKFMKGIDPEVDLLNSIINSQLDQIIPTASTSAPITVKSKIISPILSHHQPSYHDHQINEIKKSVDNTIDYIKSKKHESMNSITGSDDSNRIYETAVESPIASTSTATFESRNLSNNTMAPIFQNNHHALSTSASVSSLSTNNIKAPITLLPVNASDSSETVTPAESILYHQHQLNMELDKNINHQFKNMNIVRPIPQKPYQQQQQKDNASTSEMKNEQHYQPSISSKKSDPIINVTLTQDTKNNDLETLQQQVKLIQQQREVDRAEFQRLEQLHVERTKKMREEIERTQSRLQQLTAAKQNLLPPSSSISSTQLHHHHHHLQEQIQDTPSNTHQSHPLQSKTQKYHDNTHYDDNDGMINENNFKYSQSNTNTPSKLNKSKSIDNLSRLSRNSSKSSNNGNSIKLKKNLDVQQQQQQQRQIPSDLFQQEPVDQILQNQNNNNDIDQVDSLLEEQLNLSYGKRSANTSQSSINGRRSQQPSRQSYDRPQRVQQQNYSSPQQVPRTRSRQQRRPRSKSTDAPQPPMMEWGPDYYVDSSYDDDDDDNNNDDYQRPRRPSRPKSNNSNKGRSSASGKARSQRSRSIDQTYPPYYEYPPYYMQPILINDFDNNYGMPIDGEVDEELLDDRFIEMDPRFQQQFQQQQIFDSFPPPQRRPMRPRSHHPHHQIPSPFPPHHPHFMAGPMAYMPPSTPITPNSSSSSSFNGNNNRSRMNPSRMNMEMQQAAATLSSDYENPAFYSAIPPPPPQIRRQQQQQQPYDDVRMMHGMMMDEDYWQPSPGSNNGNSNNSNNRYPGPPPPHPFMNHPPYMRMNDPSRHGNNYWRNSRPPPSA
ncbi:unnamed protein product [Cunninghamella blakesleeana]